MFPIIVGVLAGAAYLGLTSNTNPCNRVTHKDTETADVTPGEVAANLENTETGVSENEIRCQVPSGGCHDHVGIHVRGLPDSPGEKLHRPAHRVDDEKPETPETDENENGSDADAIPDAGPLLEEMEHEQ